DAIGRLGGAGVEELPARGGVDFDGGGHVVFSASVAGNGTTGPRRDCPARGGSDQNVRQYRSVTPDAAAMGMQRGRLRRQVHLAQECLVAGVIGDVLEERLADKSGSDKTSLLLLVGAFEPLQRKIVITAIRVVHGHKIRRPVCP